MRVMVVDDDRTIVDAVKALLKTEGHETAGVYSGEECMNNLKKEDADLIFLDIKMPGMNGIETLKNIKGIKPDVYVVMLTAFATVDTAVEAMKEGAFDYIRKPFATGDMRDILMNVIEDIKIRRKHKMIGLMEKQEYNCFDVFKSMFTDNVKGMCITDEKPEIIDKRYDFKDILYVQLTERIHIEEAEGGKQERVRPEEIEKLKTLIDTFINENENTVVLISSVDYLISKNSLEDIKNFVEYLGGKASDRNTSIILSASPETKNVHGLTEVEKLISELHIRHIAESISNPLRRRIILTLNDCEKCSFTRIAKEIHVRDSPKLSFHMRKLDSHGIIKQNSNREYFLSRIGKEAAEILKDMGKGDVKFLKNIVWIPGKT